MARRPTRSAGSAPAGAPPPVRRAAAGPPARCPPAHPDPPASPPAIRRISIRGVFQKDRGSPHRSAPRCHSCSHEDDEGPFDDFRHPTRGRRTARPGTPARLRPAQHQLRRRQHLRQGHSNRPGHRWAGGAHVGQGFRRRSGHPDRGGSGGAAPGPAAVDDRRLPGGGARGRDGRRVRLLPARQGRCRALHRHRHARSGGRPARRPSAPRLRYRAGLLRRRRDADQRVLRRPGGLGALAPARLPARPGHRGGQGRPSAGDRL